MTNAGRNTPNRDVPGQVHVAPGGDPSRSTRTATITAELRDAELEPDARDELTNQLIEANVEVARSVALRYRNRGIDLDDLEQVALLGLTKAARRFDPAAGHDFLAYAVPTVRGELRRHFRDHGWMVRPPRRVQDLQARLATARGELEAECEVPVRSIDLADRLGEDLPDVVEALAADGCFRPTSLDVPIGDGTSTLGELIGEDDDRLECAEARVMLAPALRRLAPRDRQMVHLRFVEGRTQQEIADAVGLSQAQVSRILIGILSTMKDEVERPSPAA